MMLALLVAAVAFAAFCVWLTIRIVNSSQLRDTLWNARATLPIVSGAGAATVCTACLLLRREARDNTVTAFDLQMILALTALPTVLFAAASLMSLRSVKLQWAVTITAALVGVLSFGAALIALFDRPRSCMAGLVLMIFMAVPWVGGAAASFVVLLIAMANLAVSRRHARAARSLDDSIGD
jgi:hypothetical protein